MEGSRSESILVAVEARNMKSILQLGILRENDVLYFVIGKRFNSQAPFLNLDAVKVSTAVKKFQTTQRKRKNRIPLTNPGEFIKAAFNEFIDCSPFKEYVNQSVTPRDLSSLYGKLSREAPSILALE